MILLIEDNPDDEALTLRALRRNHVANAVVVLRDGAEALRYLLGHESPRRRTLRALPDLVLLDLPLPKVDGLEILRQIRSDRRTQQLPVVVLASSDYEEEIVTGSGWEAISCVRKPMDFEQFSEAAYQVGLRWALVAEPLVLAAAAV